MKKRAILSFFAAAALGTVWHFLYDVFPNPLTALIAPVNESVWEHLKLLFFPPLAVFFVLASRVPGPGRNFWSGALSCVLLSPALLTGAFYALTAGFGVPAGPAFDVSLYCLCLASAWICAFRLMQSGRASRRLGALVIACGVLGTAFVVFTSAPPPLPIFISP